MGNPRSRATTPTVVSLGALTDDFDSLAGKVVQTLADGPRFVWVAEDNCVYSSSTERTSHVHESWIVGTFSLGHPAAEISEDLRVIARERAKNWILE